jgi:hypothetical protein
LTQPPGFIRRSIRSQCGSTHCAPQRAANRPSRQSWQQLCCQIPARDHDRSSCVWFEIHISDQLFVSILLSPNGLRYRLTGPPRGGRLARSLVFNCQGPGRRGATPGNNFSMPYRPPSVNSFGNYFLARSERQIKARSWRIYGTDWFHVELDRHMAMARSSDRDHARFVARQINGICPLLATRRP